MTNNVYKPATWHGVPENKTGREHLVIGAIGGIWLVQPSIKLVSEGEYNNPFETFYVVFEYDFKKSFQRYLKRQTSPVI